MPKKMYALFKFIYISILYEVQEQMKLISGDKRG